MKRLLASAAIAMLLAAPGYLYAAPVNPESHRIAFENAKKNAEVVAEVRVLTVVCTDSSVTLQVALQVLSVEKGPLKKNEIVVVSHQVTLPSGPGPGSYAYFAALHKFPFTPGAKGSVALKWNEKSRAYVAVSGWVAEPNSDPAAIPTEVGKSMSAKDSE